MALKTNMTDLRPRRDRYKREITLVSGGCANPKAFPGGKIEVYPWDSSIDEWLQEQAKTVSDSGQHQLLFRIVEKVARLNGCPLNDFLIGDVMTVLLVARAIQNDSIIEYTTACPKCSRTEQAKIKVPDELEPLGQKPMDYAGHDLVTLPDCKDVVAIRPMRIKDEIEITTRTHENQGSVSDYVARIIKPIVSINDTMADTVAELHTWYMALSPKDCADLEAKEDALTPHLSLKVPHTCDHCHTVYDFPLNLTTEFFRSGRFADSRGSVAQNI